MILEEIILKNQKELEAKKRLLPLSEIKKMAEASPPPRDFLGALSGAGIRLITEVKGASPSRGIIRHAFDPVMVARLYAEGGASAISVLTEPRYFNGSLDNLGKIKEALGDRRIPLLRKDFLTDPYQVYESRACGADSLLLIAGVLTPPKLARLIRLSYELGMSPLVEVHNENEVGSALGSGAKIIGINNRDLTTFAVDMTTTARLRLLIPPGYVVVSESGIKSRSDVERLRELGVNAVLIGEALMAASDIKAKIRELMP